MTTNKQLRELAHLAGTMLDDAWLAAVEKFKREDDEP